MELTTGDMMRRIFTSGAFFLFFAVILSTLQTFAQSGFAKHSAYRYPNETARQAYARYLKRLPVNESKSLSQDDSVTRAARPITQLNLAMIPKWNNQRNIVEFFNRVRDTRFLTASNAPSFLRRLTWLFPDDGCFVRAALMNQMLEQWKIERPAKIFAFGSLRVKTPNAPGGAVGWWYHVVPAYQVNGQVVVFDPAIDPRRILTLQEWTLSMVPALDQVNLSACNTFAYGPASPCSKATRAEEQGATQEAQRYLSYEWSRLLQLKRNPEEELGNNPPWLKSQGRLTLTNVGVPMNLFPTLQ